MDIEKLKKLVRDNPVQAAAGALAVLLVAGVVAFTIYLNGQGNNKGFAVEGSRLIVVKDGMTTADIAELLHEKKLVKNPAAFKMEARWKGLATKLQAYKLVMNALKMRTTVSIKELLSAHAEQISEQAVKKKSGISTS